MAGGDPERLKADLRDYGMLYTVVDSLMYDDGSEDGDYGYDYDYDKDDGRAPKSWSRSSWQRGEASGGAGDVLAEWETALGLARAARSSASTSTV